MPTRRPPRGAPQERPHPPHPPHPLHEALHGPPPLHEEVQRVGSVPRLRLHAMAALLALCLAALVLPTWWMTAALVLLAVLATWTVARTGYRLRVTTAGLEVAWLWPWQGDAHPKAGRRWPWPTVARVWRERDEAPSPWRPLDPLRFFDSADVVGLWHGDRVVLEARGRRRLRVGARDAPALLAAVAHARGRPTDAPPASSTKTGRAAAGASAASTDPTA